MPYAKTVLGPEIYALLYMMLGAGIGVLLIACVNVSNLLVARASLRRREVAVLMARDTRIDALELLDRAMEFSEISSRGSQRVRGVKSRVENRAGDRGVACLELLEKIFNLIRRQLRQGHDNLTLDQAELRLQSFGLVSQQFAYSAPRRRISQRRSIELEHELTRDALSQPRRNSPVLDGSLDVCSEDSSVFSQPAAHRHWRPPEVLEESGGLRRWGGLHR